MRGERSPESSFVTSYKPPVIHFFESLTPGAVNALTNGTQMVKFK